MVRLAAPLSVAVACLIAAQPARSSRVITVRPDTVLRMSDSDIYCTVLEERGTSSVACFHDPGGPDSRVRKGYAIVATEAFVAVEPPTSTKPIAHSLEPSLAAQPVFAGGASHRRLVDLAFGDAAAVGGTHMAVFVTTAKGGGDAIGVLYLDGKDQPIVGTYSIGISNHYVTIVEVTGPRKSRVTYRHAVY
jgi:hypothetical protein